MDSCITKYSTFKHEKTVDKLCTIGFGQNTINTGGVICGTNKRCFKHLTAIDQRKIMPCITKGNPLTNIGKAVDVHKSTVSRELKRGFIQSY